jgi:AraC family transcriptional regulator
MVLGNMILLANALEYMECHIGDEIRTEDIAAACYCSKSTLEKLFRFVNGISVHDYLVRRRMMKAARMLKEMPALSVLEIALCYGYSTNESFTRAFRNVWNCNPSEFRTGGRFSELYPRLLTPMMREDDEMKGRKRVDISELYDLFVTRRDCWFVCCDTRSLTSINAISRKAGDLALLETMRRMCDTAGEEDVVFRIGGDEFVLLTDSKTREYAEKIAQSLRSHEGECFEYEGMQIALGLRVGVTQFAGEKIKYDELFAGLHKVLQEAE